MATTMLNPFQVEDFHQPEVGASAWVMSTRVCVRFGLLLALVVALPFPLGLLPGTEAFAESYAATWSSLITWIGDALRITEPDARLIGYLGVAVFATLVWPMIDREDRWHSWLVRIATSILRFWIASAALGYGVGRCFSADPSTVVAGIAACTAAAALFWRRTATIGALIACVGSLGIVVPAYQSGATLDLETWVFAAAALALVIAESPRLIAALLGYATRARDTTSSLSGWWMVARWLAKAFVVGSIVFAHLDRYVIWPW